MKLVLASGSPRRSEILRLLGLDHEVRPTPIEETVYTGESPGAAAQRLASEKALATPAEDTELVIAADTLVVLGDEILGKPRDREEAKRMLLSLAGRDHRVYTGIALRLGESLEADFAVTRVWFRSLDAVECEEYVATGEPLDKAGAYGIQGLGAALIRRIDGEYFNVMGLPVQLLLALLDRHGLRYAFGSLEAV